MEDEVIKVKVEIEVVVDLDWVGMVAHYVDIFGHDYIGYWLRRIGHSSDLALGQLGWEFELDKRTEGLGFIDRLPVEIEDDLHKDAIRAWKDRQPLPPHYFALNIETAKKAWIEGVKKYGLDWYENGDADTYDYVLQMALLTEITYG